jgi:hypothetical protein
MGDANLRIPGTGAQASRELPCKTQTQISPRERQLFFSLWPIPPSRAFCGRALRRRAAAKSAATFSICRSGGSAVLLFCAKELLAGESEGSAAACFTAKRLGRCGRGAGRCAGRVCGCDRQISEQPFSQACRCRLCGLAHTAYYVDAILQDDHTRLSGYTIECPKAHPPVTRSRGLEYNRIFRGVSK